MPSDKEQIVLRAGAWRVYGSIVWVFSAFVCFSLTVTGDAGWTMPCRVVAGASLVGSLVAAVRTWRARVVLTCDEMLWVRALSRSTRYSWGEILGIESEVVDVRVFCKIFAPVITLSDGKKKALRELSGYGTPRSRRKIDGYVAVMNDWRTWSRRQTA